VAALSGNGISAVPVVASQGRVVGVVSEADVPSKQEFHGGADPAPHGFPRRRVRGGHVRVGVAVVCIPVADC
jgi:hypothetical protein